MNYSAMFDATCSWESVNKMQDSQAAANLSTNLRLAASYYPSVTQMCRKLGINRQQFVKYLAGTTFPTPGTMRRICDFIGVDEFEVLMPPDQFRNIIALRRNSAFEDLAVPPRLRELLSQAASSTPEVRRLHGYYYEYRYSYTRPGRLLRSFTHIYGWRGYTFYRRIERLKDPDNVSGPPEVFKYDGLIMPVGDRLHLLDFETITNSELTHTVLYISYPNRVSRLAGLTMGVSATSSHEPMATRVCLEYVGRSVQRSRALRACGLYEIDSGEISKFVRDYLTRSGANTDSRPINAPPL